MSTFESVSIFQWFNPETGKPFKPFFKEMSLFKNLFSSKLTGGPVTVVLRVSHQKAYFQITRDQIMTDVDEELLSIGESGTDEWEVYCCTQATAEKLHATGSFYYSAQHATEMYLLSRQLCTIRVHLLPLRVNNDEVFDWVLSFSDQLESITYESSGSSKVKGLLTGIKKIRCFLRDGVEKTDIPYDTKSDGI